MPPASTQRIHITADGRCLSELPDLKQLEQLEVVIDARLISGDECQPTLLGQHPDFLPSSTQFTLSHFEPMENGCCLLRYTRKD